MGKHAEKAKELFESGYNCSQSVLLAFAPEMGLDADTARKISAPLGGGMGRMREVCGAVSGMFMALGLTEDYPAGDSESKKAQYAEVQELAARFKEKNGSIICRTLLDLDGPDNPTPAERNEAYYHKRPCGEIVACAAGILEDYLTEKGVLKK